MKVSSKSKIISNILLIAILGTIVSWLSYTFYNAYKVQPQKLQGQIEAAEYNASSKLAGRIEKMYIKKGDIVKKGDVLYVLSSPEIEAKLIQAKAGLAAAQAVSDEANSSAREQVIQSAKDLYDSSKIMTELAKKSYERTQALYKQGVVSLQRRDELFSLYKNAQYKQNIAYQQLQIAKEGATKDTKKAFMERAKLAGGILQEVESFAKDTNVYAPIDGEISNILLHPGELAPFGFPVVLITNMQKAYVRVAVTENYLSDFKVGSVFDGYIPSLKRSARFRVNYISVMGDFATWRATSSSKGYDMKSFEVDAQPIDKIDDLRVGMSVLIDVQQ